MSYLEAFQIYYVSKRYRRNSFPLTSKQNRILDLIKNLNRPSLERENTCKVKDDIVR